MEEYTWWDYVKEFFRKVVRFFSKLMTAIFLNHGRWKCGKCGAGNLEYEEKFINTTGKHIPLHFQDSDNSGRYFYTCTKCGHKGVEKFLVIYTGTR